MEHSHSNIIGSLTFGKHTHPNCVVVIPTYNERENVGELIPHILKLPHFGILVVDDNSPDGTKEVVVDLIHQHPGRICLLSRPGKLGLGTAYLAGFKIALSTSAEYIYEMDADFSHNPKYLPELLQAAEQSFDLVIGSRYVAGGKTTDWGIIRKIISRGGNLYARVILGMSVRDATGGYRCYRRRVLESIELDHVRSNGYSFQIEMVYRTLLGRFSVQEIPIIFPDRRVGSSKMSHMIVKEAFINILRMRFFPHHMGIPTHRTSATHSLQSKPIESDETNSAAASSG